MSPEQADNRYTRGIAEFVSRLEYDTIPDEVRERIKFLILDAFGCGLYGADLEWSRILQRRLAALDTTQSCVVWGTLQKLSAPHAALINGTQVQGFELDDVHRVGVLHTGSVVLHDPAITALGPKLRQMVHVEIHLNDGTHLERTREVSLAKEKFATAAEIVAKFNKLAARVLPESRVRELRDAVLNLEQLNDAARLAQLLARR